MRIPHILVTAGAAAALLVGCSDTEPDAQSTPTPTVEQETASEDENIVDELDGIPENVQQALQTVYVNAPASVIGEVPEDFSEGDFPAAPVTGFELEPCPDSQTLQGPDIFPELFDLTTDPESVTEIFFATVSSSNCGTPEESAKKVAAPDGACAAFRQSASDQDGFEIFECESELVSDTQVQVAVTGGNDELRSSAVFTQDHFPGLAVTYGTLRSEEDTSTSEQLSQWSAAVASELAP